MLMNISVQFKLAFCSIAAGAIVGILFDLYRVIRGITRVNKYVTIFQDILFWILASIIVFIFILFTSGGKFVAYSYIFIALGVGLYLKFCSKKILSLHLKMFPDLFKVLRIILKYILYPFQKLLFFKK